MGVTMRSVILCFLLLTSLPLAADLAAADGAAAQFALPGLRAPDKPDVNGFRLAILYGDNSNMGGLDVGLLSMNESQTLSGVSLILGIHKLNGDLDGGAAFSLVNVHGGNDTGLNAAFVNKVNSAEGGVNFGFVNLADGDTMVDIGGLNVADESAVQLGFINVAKRIKGVQLGFINIAENGFLKVFPIVNFPKGGD